MPTTVALQRRWCQNLQLRQHSDGLQSKGVLLLVMDLVMEIEDELDISVPVEVLAEVQTLNQLGERLRSMIKDNPR